jgi:hypothetical protein
MVKRTDASQVSRSFIPAICPALDPGLSGELVVNTDRVQRMTVADGRMHPISVMEIQACQLG